MKATSLNFDAAMAEGARLILIVYFVNAYGVRVWATQHPPKIADAAGDEHLADGTWKADGSIKAGSDLGGILERAGRIVEGGIGALEEGNPEASLEETQAETDPAVIEIRVDNEDGAMSALEAQENIVSAVVRLTAIHPGAADWIDRLELGEFVVTAYTFERDWLELECLAT